MEAVQGMSVIHNPTFNKGSAFTEEERKNFKLHGLVPPNTQTLEEQVHRAYEQYSSRADDLAKNTFMASMKMQNEVLYFRVSTIIFKGEADICETFFTHVTFDIEFENLLRD